MNNERQTTMFYAYGIVLFNANYRAPSSARLNSFKRQTMCEEFNANFRKLIQFMLSLSKYLRQNDAPNNLSD